MAGRPLRRARLNGESSHLRRANCVTATPRGIVRGISLNAGRVVLGETGRARKILTLAVPPGAVVEADRLIAAGAGKNGAILAPTDGDPWLVRVRTDHAYTRGTSSAINVIGGGIVAEGFTAWGDAGNLGAHKDAILAMREGAVAVVTFTGGRSKGGGHRLIVVTATGPVVVDTGDAEGNVAAPDLDPIHVLGVAGVETLIGKLAAVGTFPGNVERLSAMVARATASGRW